MTQDDRTSPSAEPVAENDLSRVLPCLTSWYSGTRKTQAARDKLANHPLTREYLDAGLRLIAEQFLPQEGTPGRSDGDPGAAGLSKQSAFFDWLSAQKVINEVDRGGTMRGNQGTFDDRWPYRDYYIQDLLSYALWVRHWAREAEIAQQAVVPFTVGADVAAALHEAAYWSCQAQLASASARVWLVATAVSDRYPAMKTAIGKIHETLDASWRPVYDAVIAGRGLRLRPGVTVEDLTEILSALTTGVSLRTAAGSGLGSDDARHRSLPGTAAIAVLASFIDPGDGRTLDQVITELVEPHPNGKVAQASA